MPTCCSAPAWNANAAAALCNLRLSFKARRKVFFSEEKKQKTFMVWSGGKIRAVAGILGLAEM
jgi:hypothetical protein